MISKQFYHFYKTSKYFIKIEKNNILNKTCYLIYQMDKLTLDDIINHIKLVHITDNIVSTNIVEEDDTPCSILNPPIEHIPEPIFPPVINKSFGNLQKVSVSDDKLNYSLLHCVLFCLCEQYESLKRVDKNVYVYNLRDRLIQFASTNFKSYKQNKDFTKNDLLSLLKNDKNECHGDLVYKIIEDFFGINIIILNIRDDSINIVNEKNFSKYKNILILGYVESIKLFEPVVFNNKRIHNYDDGYIPVNSVEEDLFETFNFYNIINPFKKVIEQTSFVLKKNMRLAELQTLASNNGVDIVKEHNKKKTCKELYEELLALL